MSANPDSNQSSSDNSMSFNKIHHGDDFDAMIQNAMSASSEQVSEAANIAHPSENDDNFTEDLERGSLSAGSSAGSDADANSLGSDDISVVSDEEDHQDSFVSHVPLVNDDESVMEMKNPAPVSQSVSSYVDQLNRRERGKSRLIIAGVFAFFIAFTVGITFAVISVTGSKEKGVGTGQVVVQSPGSPKDQNSPGVNAGEENVLDNLFRSVEIIIDGTISLSGLVIPAGMLKAVKDSLEKAIAETVSNSLTQDQTVTGVIVTLSRGRVLYRVLGDISVVVFEMTVKEKCRDCDDKILQSMKETLYQRVVSGLMEAIDTGDFTDNLHKQAKTSGNNALLSVNAIDADFAMRASQPTQPNNQVPEFILPQLPPPSPTLPPSTISNVATYSPVAQTTYVSTPHPTTMAPITPSPTLSLVTAAPVTKAPFALPPVEFAPTDPPVLTAPPVVLATPNPTKNPTNSPTLRPTPRPTPKPVTNRPTQKPVVISSDAWFCAKASFTENWNTLLEFGDCDKRCPSMSHSDCETGYQCRQSNECLELVGPP